MRLVRVSLAAKYRILFGAAVLLIIAAALAVPWQTMASLVYEQPFREAQRIADDYFRLVLAVPAGAAHPAGEFHGKESSLLPPALRQEPQFIRLTADPEDPASILHDSKADPFVQRACRRFLRDPKQAFWYTTQAEGGGRRFRYAHAVRVGKSCLTCHNEGGTAPPVFRENQLAGLITVNLPVDVTSQVLWLNRAWLIVAGLLAGIVAVLVFYFITHRYILSPIHELRAVANRVAEGDLDVRAAAQTGDEFEQLSDNLNYMLERLRASQQELKKANQLLDQKLGEMAQTNVALYEANRLKSEFLANVSHELRTPLTNIIGFAELLREGPPTEGDGRVARYAENILISGRILLEIINDLLDLAKIEAGRVELHLEQVRVDETCATLVDFMRPQADKKHLHLTLTADESLPTLSTDRGKLRQILFNLLSNAIKFTPEEGRVELILRSEDAQHVRIEVRDTGPGIAPEHQALIFEKFRQIDGSATREHRGAGLGLAIAHELTQFLGGQIGVQSEPGRGSTFWLRLPLTTPGVKERPAISLV